ncbi:MAG: molybdopterin-dependent oxidoreductase, partial [Bacteroidales bacterium]|nr:molybdopterin-dependent oxidoreductase [Bacteroidales bacterium]
AIDRDTIVSTLSGAGFMMVQDYTLSDTALLADLVLPATYPFETGGSFTNTQRFLQRFDKEAESPVSGNNLEQLGAIAANLGIEADSDPDVILNEMFGFLPSIAVKHQFRTTDGKANGPLFRYGADILEKLFAEYYDAELER